MANEVWLVGKERKEEIPGLIARARSGDRDALGRLFAHFQNYLRLVISAAMGPGMRRSLDISDVVQETLLVAAARFGKFHGDDERQLAYWLRSLANRKVVDLARRIGRQKRAPANQVSLDETHDGSPLAEQLAGELTSPSQGAVRHEMALKLAEALTKIDPVEAEVIWLHHIEGMSFEAIGQRIGTGRNGARGVWARALKNLRRVLPKDESGTFGR